MQKGKSIINEITDFEKKKKRSLQSMKSEFVLTRGEGVGQSMNPCVQK